MTSRKPLIAHCRALFLPLALVPLHAYAAPFDVAGPSANNVDVPDTSPVVLNFDIADTGYITSLGVRVSLDTTGDGGAGYWDNVFVQISHGGVDVVLMDLQADGVGNIATLAATFSDGGADLAASALVDGATAGTFAPQNPLSAFNGIPLQGQWTITIWDDTHPNDGTDLSAFSIFGDADATPPPPGAAPAAPAATVEQVPALPVFGLGAMALGILVLARRYFSRRK
ncbi:hypothetical protein [Haliea sp. E17]|uniref:hypothetical protein n=1 Tax=Haliea sp. E17 TaxID=3401576 RepID=UPI003AACE253